MTQMTIHEALRWASLFLQKHNREERVAEFLLLHHLDMSKAQLLTSLRETLSVETQAAFVADLKKHVETGVPVQHLTGSEEFFGRTFSVNKNVLIPRPETEELVLGVLEHVDKAASINLVDLGTGSGIIAITLKLERPEWNVSASDLSTAALAVAKKNAERLGAEVAFRQGDFLQPIIEAGEKVDIIVSNPPYIPYEDEGTLSDTVENFDPKLALFAEEQGLAAYIKIISQAKQVIKQEGLLAFEIGYQQGGQVSELIHKQFPGCTIEIRKDINGKDRMVFAEIQR